jgi:hypothetical protein
MRAFFVLEKATIGIDFAKSPIVMIYPQEGEKYPLELPAGDGYYYELKDFTDNFETGEFENLVTAESAAETIRLALLEIDSARQEKELRV